MNIFVSWIGFNDVNSLNNLDSVGPIRSFLNSDLSGEINEHHFLYNDSEQLNTHDFRCFLEETYPLRMFFHDVGKINPTDYKSIYEVVTPVLESIRNNKKNKTISWHFHTSPGTPQMSSIWLLLGASEYPAQLYQSYNNEVKPIDIPFNIDAQYVEKLRDKADMRLYSSINDMSGISSISHKSEIMKGTLETAFKIAIRDVPAFILGETGTGKEEFAKLIHKNSKRSEKPFYAVNCAAIPENLIESTLFGYEKGAFTGAADAKVGIFESCNGGTVFLDEIGDLSLSAQTKILRVLQEFEIQRVGAVKPIKVDVRLISATHKDPVKLINEGRFREDLFHRISIGLFKLPPLRDRSEDILSLAEFFLDETNSMFSKDSEIYPYEHKKLSSDTKKFIISYSWPGNVRALKNTIIRACMLIDESKIKLDKFKERLLLNDDKNVSIVDLNKVKLPLQLDDLINDIKTAYIKEALTVAGGNKTEAAKLLGWKNYQNLDHYIKKMNL